MTSFLKAIFTAVVLISLFLSLFRVEYSERYFDKSAGAKGMSINEPNDKYPKVCFWTAEDAKSSLYKNLSFWLEFNDPGIFSERGHKMGFDWDENAQIPRIEQPVEVVPTSPLKTSPPKFKDVELAMKAVPFSERLFNTHKIYLSKFESDVDEQSKLEPGVKWLLEDGSELKGLTNFAENEKAVLQIEFKEIKSPTVISFFYKKDSSQRVRFIVEESCGSRAVDSIALRKLSYFLAVDKFDLKEIAREGNNRLTVFWRLMETPK